MIRNICTDRFFLMQPSEPAAAADLPVAQDLRDTLAAHISNTIQILCGDCAPRPPAAAPAARKNWSVYYETYERTVETAQ